MKLNQKKCTFGIPSGKRLGYLVSEIGIKANLAKIKLYRIWLNHELLNKYND